MNEPKDSCPPQCLPWGGGDASARCLGLQTAAASALTDLSRMTGHPSSPHLNFRQPLDLQACRLQSNGRVKRIGKSKAWTAKQGQSTVLGLTSHKSDHATDYRAPLRPRLRHSAEKPQLRFSTQASQKLAKTRNRPSRKPVGLPTPSRFHRPARKAVRFLSPDSQGSARRLIFPTHSFSATHLMEMLRTFDPKAFYVRVDAEYPSRPSSEFGQKARAVLLNWVLLVHRKFGFRFQTFFTAVHLLDSFLSRDTVAAADLQLLGLTVLFTAAKFEEVKPPKLAKFLSITEKQFSHDAVITLEGRILASIGFQISTESPCQLLEVIAELQHLPRIISETALGFLVGSCFDLRMNSFGSDHIVHAAVSLARHVVTSINESDSGRGPVPKLVGFATAPVEGSAAVCMRNLSLIVLNLERAGMLAIRKAFPESFERGCEDSLALINHC